MAVPEFVPFQPDIAALLAPVPGALECGSSMRYDPAFLVIRQAKEEDDTTVPRGEWERALKKADWKLVASTCLQLLDGKTKDFQVAAWLCEAWIYLHHIEGMNAAIQVLHGFAEKYWDTAHPLIDDGDEDARVAPFVWMNENLPLVLNLHVPLIYMPDRKRATVSLADWDRTLVVDTPTSEQVAKAVPGEEKPLTRDDVIAAATGANLSRLIQMKLQLGQAISAWSRLAELLDRKVQSSPPSIARVTEMLRRMERVVASLVNGRDAVEEPQEIEQQQDAQEQRHQPLQEPQQVQQPTQQAGKPVAARSAYPGVSINMNGSIENREDAYRMLESIAEYLMKTEPHSPTPYLIKRAVAWGRMSLVDLMLEVVREEGDMTRYLSLLGIKEGSETGY